MVDLLPALQQSISPYIESVLRKLVEIGTCTVFHNNPVPLLLAKATLGSGQLRHKETEMCPHAT